jgi:hypothetical protein
MWYCPCLPLPFYLLLPLLLPNSSNHSQFEYIDSPGYCLHLCLRIDLPFSQTSFASVCFLIGEKSYFLPNIVYASA